MKNRIYRCLVIDDEPIARKIVRNYIGQMPNLEFSGECKNALEGLERLNLDEGIEIIFLDINMPNLSGVSLAKLLSKKHQIIFTTAYSEFAIESYDLDAADYLLKPFLLERFTKAVVKAIDRIKGKSISGESVNDFSLPGKESLYVKSNGETFSLLIQDILFCEAMKNYIKIITKGDRIYTPLITLSKFEKELSLKSDYFMRIHRSFIISKKHIFSIGSNYVMIDKHKVPIGEQYKKDFISEFKLK